MFALPTTTVAKRGSSIWLVRKHRNIRVLRPLTNAAASRVQARIVFRGSVDRHSPSESSAGAAWNGDNATYSKSCLTCCEMTKEHQRTISKAFLLHTPHSSCTCQKTSASRHWPSSISWTHLYSPLELQRFGSEAKITAITRIMWLKNLRWGCRLNMFRGSSNRIWSAKMSAWCGF